MQVEASVAAALDIMDDLSPASRQAVLAWRAIAPVFRKDTLTSAMLAAVGETLRGRPSEFH